MLWDDPAAAQKLLRERTRLDQAIGSYRRIAREVDEAIELIELGEAEGEPQIVAEAEASLEKLRAEAARRELESLLSGEADGNDCYLEVHAGAGGTEAQDWAEMLLRMYARWAEAHGHKVEWLEESGGEEAGIKSATIRVAGPDAYGWLKTESGVHRLVRISPFDSNDRRHTSFASVWVYPVVDDKIEVEINDKDLRIDTYRSSGAGGQHVNKTDSAVRITHGPSGIVVQCQSERSQHQNRAHAFAMLRARLYEAELQRREAVDRRDERDQDRYRLGSPDPLLRAAALSDGQGFAHRGRDGQHRCCARRRHRPFFGRGIGRPHRGLRRDFDWLIVRSFVLPSVWGARKQKLINLG